MIDSWDKNKIYRTLISPHRCMTLLDTYINYSSLVCDLEEFIEYQKSKGLSIYGSKEIYGDEKQSPWLIEDIQPEDNEIYKGFILNQPVSRKNHNCYISLNKTIETKENEGLYITPKDYNTYRHCNILPHRVERFTIAYQKDELLKNAVFIIDGKYKISYEGNYKEKKISEALEDTIFEKQLICMLEVVAQFNKSPNQILPSELKSMHTEALASAVTSPLEYMILESLSYLTEITHNIVKDILIKRVRSGYLAKAEKEGLILSASAIQDYMNVRNLMYHQRDTLDGIGKFNEIEKSKSRSIRQRFQDSYSKLFNKPLQQRIQTYKMIIDDFVPLIVVLTPNFIVKGKNESRAKFVKRIEEATRNYPNIYVDTRMSAGEKKQNLIKNLKKIYPEILFTDSSMVKENSYDTFINRMQNFLLRRQYINRFQEVEYLICRHCLLQGKNYTPLIAWDFFRRHSLLTPQEAHQWLEYKKLRNDLSHKYQKQEKTSDLEEMLRKIDKDADILISRIEEKTPLIQKIGDKVYRAIHENGLTVDIDFEQQKVLQVVTSSGYTYTPTIAKSENKKLHSYTEEYQNGMAITLSGADVTSCQLNQGVKINFKRKFIQFSNASRIYCDRPETCLISVSLKEKLITDKQLKILKYISNGESITVGKNEIINLSNHHQIKIDRNGYLEEENGINDKKQKIVAKYHKTDNGYICSLNDGTKIVVENTNIRVYHKGLELTYQTRKEFSDSYNSIKLPLSNQRD